MPPQYGAIDPNDPNDPYGKKLLAPTPTPQPIEAPYEQQQYEAGVLSPLDMPQGAGGQAAPQPMPTPVDLPEMQTARAANAGLTPPPAPLPAPATDAVPTSSPGATGPLGPSSAPSYSDFQPLPPSQNPEYDGLDAQLAAINQGASPAAPSQPGTDAGFWAGIDQGEQASGGGGGEPRYLNPGQPSLYTSQLAQPAGRGRLLDAAQEQDFLRSRRSDADWNRNTYGGQAIDAEKRARGARASTDALAAQTAYGDAWRTQLQGMPGQVQETRDANAAAGRTPVNNSVGPTTGPLARNALTDAGGRQAQMRAKKERV